MSQIGGSCESCSIRGRNFPVAADADATLQIGGWQNEVQPNGDGTVRIIKTRVPPMVEGVALGIDHNKADLEFLQEIAESGDLVPFALTLASGVVWQGKMTITGEVKGSTMNATAPLTFTGEDKLEQQ